MYGDSVDAILVRAREILSDIDVRAYTAAVVSRLQQRAPYGARRTVTLPSSTPTRLANNSSKSRVLRVDLEWFSPSPTFLSDSPGGGRTNFVTASNNLPIGFAETYVLRPDEQLFATTQGAAGAVLVGQEWF